jgi:effector-binding domain-containing protein
VIDATETPYLNAEGSSTMEPADISAAMSEIFKQVFEFMQANAIAPAGPAISVYPGYDPKTMNFRAGFIIHRQDMWKASGPVAADLTPSGPALHFTHTGSYRTLRDDYGAMMQFAEDQSLMVGAPAWEIYINDPSQTPEAELLTECYAKLASAGLRLLDTEFLLQAGRRGGVLKHQLLIRMSDPLDRLRHKRSLVEA